MRVGWILSLPLDVTSHTPLLICGVSVLASGL